MEREYMDKGSKIMRPSYGGFLLLLIPHFQDISYY